MESAEFKEIPISALKNKTREIISNSLNSCKILLSPEGFRRDYRGLANSANIPLPPSNYLDPTSFVLKKWESSANPSLSEFILTLQSIDRWDVIDDVIDLIKDDALAFSQKTSELTPVVSTRSNDLRSDHHIITIGDVARIEKGLEPEVYDAFLLYSDEDAEFACRALEKLEGQHNLKLCLKDRDLVGGITFEHEAIMRLISERCNRLIVIFSPSFLESPANKFFVNYAQALGIEQRERKIVPCMYKKVELPPEFRFYFFLDYTRSNPFWSFWDKLGQSLKAPEFVSSPERRALLPPVSITELPPSVSELPSERLSSSQWDCPNKTPKGNLPATEAGSSSADVDSALPVPQQAAVPRSPQKKKKNEKSKIEKLMASIFPSPPSDEPGKTHYLFRKKKKKVKSPAV